MSSIDIYHIDVGDQRSTLLSIPDPKLTSSQIYFVRQLYIGERNPAMIFND